MEKRVKVVARPDGTLQFLDTPEAKCLHYLGGVTLRRASRVVPVNLLKRLAFRLIRASVSDHSHAAAWTRRWRGPWLADLSLSNGPVLGPYDSRQEAIEAEIKWINQ